MSIDETFEHRLTTEPAELEDGAALLSHWMRSRSLGTVERRDALIIASELCAAARPGTVVTLRAELHGDRLVLDVEGDGEGFTWNGHQAAGAVAGGMKGLRRVGSVADEVTVVAARGGTVLTSTKLLT